MHPLIAKFCRQFFVHFYDFYPSMDEAAKLGLGALTKEEQKEFAPVLDEIIARYSTDELVKLWNSSPADVHTRGGEEIRMLFKTARRRIG
jgi:hypothetical protein